MLDAFFNKAIPEPNTGCWLWTGAVRSDGYVRTGGVYAHRRAYERAIGPIPDGLVIDHLCRVRCCINPEHLEAVTQAENMRRAVCTRSTKTHCGAGHEFAVAGKYFRPNRPSPRCMECARISRRNFRAREAA